MEVNLRALKGGAPRAGLHHGSVVGRRYTAAARSLRARHGDHVPAVLIRLAARLEAVEIPPLEQALDKAAARGRQTEVRRIRRQLTGCRVLLLKTLERIETAADHEPSSAAFPGLADALQKAGRL